MAVFDQSVLEALQILGIFGQFLADLQGEEGSCQDSDECSRDGYLHYVEQCDAVSAQKSEKGYCRCGYRTGCDCLLGRYHGYSQRPFRTDLGLSRNFGDYRQKRICDMARSCEEGEQIGHERGDDSDAGRVATEHLFRDLDHVVKSSCGLHA